MSEAGGVRRDLDAWHGGEFVREVQGRQHRGVVAHDVVLGRHGEVDARGHEREDAVLWRNRGIEARPRMYVEIGADDAGRRNDVAQRQLDAGSMPWGDV